MEEEGAHQSREGAPLNSTQQQGGKNNKGCQKRSFSLEEGQATSVHTLKLGKSTTRAQLTPSGKNLGLVEAMAPSPRCSSIARPGRGSSQTRCRLQGPQSLRPCGPCPVSQELHLRRVFPPFLLHGKVSTEEGLEGMPSLQHPGASRHSRGFGCQNVAQALRRPASRRDSAPSPTEFSQG